jgi:hypothetical protein
MDDDRLNVSVVRELLGYLLVVLLATSPWIALKYFGPLHSFLIALAVCATWRLLAGGLYHPKFAAAGCGWVIVVPLVTIAIFVDVALLIARLYRPVS